MMQSVSETPQLGRQEWTRADLVVLAALGAVAAIAIALAYCLSSARRAIDYRTLAWGLGLQFLFAFIVLKTSIGRNVFEALGGVITRVLNFTYVGSSFVFGPLGD